VRWSTVLGCVLLLKTERPTRVRYWVIVFAVTLAVITYVDRVTIGVVAPLMQHDLNLTKKQWGWCLGAFALAYSLFEMPGGFMADRMGPRKVLLRIVVWWSFFTAATGFTFNRISVMTTQFMFGMGEAGCFPNLTRIFHTWLPAKERVRAQGIMWLSARWGGAFTPPLVYWVVSHVGWRHAFPIFGCLGVIWVVAFWAWFRDNPADNPKVNAAELKLLRHEAGHAVAHVKISWKRLLSSRSVWLLCWQYFFLSYGWYFYIQWLPTYLQEGRHMTLAKSSWLGVVPLFFGGIGNMAGVALGSRLTRATGSVPRARRYVAFLGFLGASSFLMLSTRLHDPVIAVVAIGMASFCNDLVMPGAWGTAMDVGGVYCGTVSGAMNMWGNLAGAVAPVLTGYILTWGHDNWDLTFYVSAGIYLMGIVCWAFLDSNATLEKA
jgi:ACS family glucarate transporter-like MFS transporter